MPLDPDNSSVTAHAWTSSAAVLADLTRLAGDKPDSVHALKPEAVAERCAAHQLLLAESLGGDVLVHLVMERTDRSGASVLLATDGNPRNLAISCIQAVTSVLAVVQDTLAKNPQAEAHVDGGFDQLVRSAAAAAMGEPAALTDGTAAALAEATPHHHQAARRVELAADAAEAERVVLTHADGILRWRAIRRGGAEGASGHFALVDAWQGVVLASCIDVRLAILGISCEQVDETTGTA